MRRKLFSEGALTLLAILILFCGATGVSAEVPKLINYQGMMTDAAGNLRNDTLTITYAIYASAVGGAPLWQETREVVCIDGIYNVLLGSVTEIPDNLFNDPNRYLGVTVGAEAEMTPRQQFTSVPYAFNATSTAAFGNLEFVGFGTISNPHSNTIIPQHTLTRVTSEIAWFPVPDFVPDSATYIYCSAWVVSDGYIQLFIYDSNGRIVEGIAAIEGASEVKMFLPIDAQRKIGYSVYVFDQNSDNMNFSSIPNNVFGMTNIGYVTR